MITPYGKVSRAVAKSLKPMARALLLTITCCINRKTNELRLSLKQLAEESGMNVDTVVKWIAELEQRGLLLVQRSKGGNHNAMNIYRLAGEAATVGLWNQSAESPENSETFTPSNPPHVSKISIAGLEKTEGLLNELKITSDDDDFLTHSDSGEFALEKEGRDESQEAHDASRKYLEEHGVKAPALAAAAHHPLPVIERAFELAEQKNAQNKAAYALGVLKNGDYQPKPSWMNNLPSPSVSVSERNGVGAGGGVSFGYSSAVKTIFQKQHNPYAGSSWADYATPLNETCPDCYWPLTECHCEKEAAKAHA